MKFKLIKGRSYTGSFSATRKKPIVELNTDVEIKEAETCGYFEAVETASEVSASEEAKEQVEEVEEKQETAEPEEEAAPAFESEVEEAKPKTKSKSKK